MHNRSLCVDNATVQCIRMWLVPLASNWKPPPRSITVKFDLVQLQKLVAKTQKVIWNDDEHGWEVNALDADKHFIKIFPVERSLQDYDVHQVDELQWRKAVEQWNKADGTGRKRIKLPKPLFRNASLDVHATTADSGSQSLGSSSQVTESESQTTNSGWQIMDFGPQPSDMR